MSWHYCCCREQARLARDGGQATLFRFREMTADGSGCDAVGAEKFDLSPFGSALLRCQRQRQLHPIVSYLWRDPSPLAPLKPDETVAFHGLERA